MVEATVFVIATGMSPAAAIEEAIDAVGREKIVGVVLNRVEADASGDAAYYNYYPNPAAPQAPRSSPPAGTGRMGL
jgi:hypothetical protein